MLSSGLKLGVPRLSLRTAVFETLMEKACSIGVIDCPKPLRRVEPVPNLKGFRFVGSAVDTPSLLELVDGRKVESAARRRLINRN